MEYLNLETRPKCLLILDVNGILVKREWDASPSPTADLRLGSFNIWIRPGLQDFIRRALRKYQLAFWSSMQPKNLIQLLTKLFGKDFNPLFIWGQEMCEKTLHPDGYKSPVGRWLLSKNLKLVWDKYPQFDIGTTLIIDDTELKMRNNPERSYLIVDRWEPGMGGFEEIMERLEI